MNGLSERVDKKIALIGVGSLGSHVFMNLMRSGYGEWTLIDEDYLNPHNLARHVLTGSAISLTKAECIAYMANDTIEGEAFARSIHANVLHPKENADAVNAAFSEADTILDISTSIAVARHIALDITSDARRVSMFLNPSGTDAVMLVEGTRRESTLDFLEIQYYRYLLTDEEMTEHLSRPAGRVRYSNSCRDISSTVSQENIALYSAILSKAFRVSVQEQGGSITIWYSDSNHFGIKYKRFYPEGVVVFKYGEWTICTDNYFLKKTADLRASKLPNETGGILIGSFDTLRKIVYIVDTVPSPPDSKEWPTVYIRGCQGLRNKLEKIQKNTDNRLEYVGEWHSHPVGYPPYPSEDDEKAFKLLTGYMLADGYPAVMMICSEDYVFYVGQMIRA